MEINDEMIKNSDNVTRCQILKGIITGENQYFAVTTLDEIKIKQMEYSSERKREILFEGKYKNYQFYILNLGTHPTAYVEIPKRNKLYGKSYHYIDIDVHGGLTYSEDYLKGIKENSWFIGWDYGHFGDYMGYQVKLPVDFSMYDKKWTTEEIFEEVKDVINQIIDMEVA